MVVVAVGATGNTGALIILFWGRVGVRLGVRGGVRLRRADLLTVGDLLRARLL